MISDETVAMVQQLVWSDRATRSRLEENGICIVPANFYSTVPTLAEMESSFESRDENPYLSDLFDPARLAGVLGEVRQFSPEIDAPLLDDAQEPGGFFWQNGQFGYSDAVAYYSLIRSRKPQTIVEVGAGFSTPIASAAIKANGSGRIICVEPYPRAFLENVPFVEEIVREGVQNLEADWFNARLKDGDFLFIDSTHTVKIGSDCLHLYLRILPRLARELLVHVHDIFLPDGMPVEWAREQHIYWTEQYLLLAYLLDNPLVKVEWGSHYHALFNRQALEALAPAEIAPGGSSLWFSRLPRGGAREGRLQP